MICIYIYMHQWTTPSLVQIMACHLLAPSHYLNHYWLIVNWILVNKLQWNFNQNATIFTQENASQTVVCKMVAIRSRCKTNTAVKLAHLPPEHGRHFGRRHFQMNFLEWKWQNSDSNFTEICFRESNWWKASIGSGNGLAPNRRQAITWTNDDPINWHWGRWDNKQRSVSWLVVIKLTFETKCAVISQTTFSSAFLWMKTVKFQMKFQWNMFIKI